MGLVRKTMSVATLGFVSFRSKKEKLLRANASRHRSEVALEEEHGARLAAEMRVAEAEKQMNDAHSDAKRARRQLKKRKRRAGRSARISQMIAETEPVVRSGTERAIGRGRKAGRKAGRRARKAARHATAVTKNRAASVTKDVVMPKVEQVVAKVTETIDEHHTS